MNKIKEFTEKEIEEIKNYDKKLRNMIKNSKPAESYKKGKK